MKGFAKVSRDILFYFSSHILVFLLVLVGKLEFQLECHITYKKEQYHKMSHRERGVENWPRKCHVLFGWPYNEIEWHQLPYDVKFSLRQHCLVKSTLVFHTSAVVTTTLMKN
jgi:hypothetical protein